MTKTSKPRTPAWLRMICAAILGVLIVGLAVAPFVAKIQAGHGLDYYYSGFGDRWNAIAALVTLAAIFLAVPLGWLVRWWTERRMY